MVKKGGVPCASRMERNILINRDHPDARAIALGPEPPICGLPGTIHLLKLWGYRTKYP